MLVAPKDRVQSQAKNDWVPYRPISTHSTFWSGPGTLSPKPVWPSLFFGMTSVLVSWRSLLSSSSSSVSIGWLRTVWTL